MTVNINANIITESWLNSKPRSYAKDFYIWQFLQQNITSNQAAKILRKVKNVNNKILFSYAKKLQDTQVLNIIKCMKYNTKTLVNQNSSCIDIGLSIYDMTKLNKKELNKVYNLLKKDYPQKASQVNIIRSNKPFELLISSDKNLFFDIFNNCGSIYREKYLNYEIYLNKINKLIEDKRFQQTIKLIVTNSKLINLHKSLINIDDNKLPHISSFFLALNSIKYNNKKSISKYLNNAYKKSYYQFDKDKTIFWKYLIYKDINDLRKLSKSWDINIYSIYAKEKLDVNITNVVYNIQPSKKITKLNNNREKYISSDPFFWLSILKKSKNIHKQNIMNYEKKLYYINTLPHLSLLYERYYKYKKSYFIMPFIEYMKQYDKNRQSLIYAIGRQESRFIQSSISTSYAMGVMQIMPFLSKAIAKELDLKYDIMDQLKAKHNLKYANHHLNYLERKFKNPLLIAYAYNGGIGFTMRLLKKGFFNKNGSYKRFEPFLSMELLPYDETRKYGKKVLANYYIYSNYINNKLKIKTLFENIMK